MAKKKVAAKKKSAKPAAKPAAPKAIKTALNRAGLVAHISDASGVAPRACSGSTRRTSIWSKRALPPV